jgi:predicted amidohydrolase
MRFWSKKIALALVVLLLLPGVSYALTDNQKALVGLPGLSVSVAVDPRMLPFGLTEEQIKTDVELRLRKAGIKVVEGRWPLLAVSITTMIRSATIFYAIEMGLSEIATLDRGIRASGTIWNTGYMGVTGTAKIREVRNAVGDQVDKFINDYLAANPKK